MRVLKHHAPANAISRVDQQRFQLAELTSSHQTNPNILLLPLSQTDNRDASYFNPAALAQTSRSITETDTIVAPGAAA